MTSTTTTMNLPSIPTIATSLIKTLSAIDTHSQQPATETPNTTTLTNPLSSLFSRQTSSSSSSSSPSSSEIVKPLLATLHVLFPHEFIPALDILDRKLVLELSTEGLVLPGSESNPDHPDHPNTKPKTEIRRTTALYVRSASSSLSSFDNNKYKLERGGGTGATGYYEVHLNSWNCTCPAFSYSAFGRNLGGGGVNIDSATSSSVPTFSIPYEPSPPPPENSRHGNGDDDGKDWLIGGTLTLPSSTSTSTTTTTTATATSSEEGSPPLPICKHTLAAALATYAPSLFGHGVERRQVPLEEMAAWAAGWGD